MKTELTCYGSVYISDTPIVRDIDLGDGKTTKVINLRGKTTEKIPNGSNMVSFFDFELWDSAAEYIATHAVVGDTLIIMSCTPRESRWEKDGIKRSKVVFRVNSFYLVKA